MGNQESHTPEEGDSTNLYDPTSMVKIQEVNDGRFGQIKILKNNASGDIYCQLVKTLNTEQAYEAKIKQCQLKHLLRHENIVQLKNFTHNQNEEFCSSFWKVSMLFEYSNLDLRREIMQRSKKGRIFTDEELWYIISSTVKALLYYQEQNVHHGDVRPFSILITHQGKIKLSDTYQFNQHLNGYSQVVMDLREEMYLTPQLFSLLQVKVMNPKVDWSKVEVYALALTVLESAILQNSQDIYDMEQFEIKQDVLNSKLELCNQTRLPELTQLLKLMLEPNDDRRISLQQLTHELDQKYNHLIGERIILSNEPHTQQQNQPNNIVKPTNPPTGSSVPPQNTNPSQSVSSPKLNNNQSQLITQPATQPQEPPKATGVSSNPHYSQIPKSSGIGAGLSLAPPTPQKQSPTQQQEKFQYLRPIPAYLNNFNNNNNPSANEAPAKKQSPKPDRFLNIEPNDAKFNNNVYLGNNYVDPLAKYTVIDKYPIKPNSSLSSPSSQVVPSNYAISSTKPVNMTDLDERINAVLNASRDTVNQYGGPTGIQVYTGKIDPRPNNLPVTKYAMQGLGNTYNDYTTPSNDNYPQRNYDYNFTQSPEQGNTYPSTTTGQGIGSTTTPTVLSSRKENNSSLVANNNFPTVPVAADNKYDNKLKDSFPDYKYSDTLGSSYFPPYKYTSTLDSNKPPLSFASQIQQIKPEENSIKLKQTVEIPKSNYSDLTTPSYFPVTIAEQPNYDEYKRVTEPPTYSDQIVFSPVSQNKKPLIKPSEISTETQPNFKPTFDTVGPSTSTYNKFGGNNNYMPVNVPVGGGSTLDHYLSKPPLSSSGIMNFGNYSPGSNIPQNKDLKVFNELSKEDQELIAKYTTGKYRN